MANTEIARLLHDDSAPTYAVDSLGRPVDAFGDLILSDEALLLKADLRRAALSGDHDQTYQRRQLTFIA